jgi:hypothetical protein
VVTRHYGPIQTLGTPNLLGTKGIYEYSHQANVQACIRQVLRKTAVYFEDQFDEETTASLNLPAQPRVGGQVRQAPSRLRRWANLSRLQLQSHRNARASLRHLGRPNAGLAPAARSRSSTGSSSSRCWQGSVALSLCTTADPLYTTFTNIFGTSISEATLRPDPRCWASPASGRCTRPPATSCRRRPSRRTTRGAATPT